MPQYRHYRLNDACKHIKIFAQHHDDVIYSSRSDCVPEQRDRLSSCSFLSFGRHGRIVKNQPAMYSPAGAQTGPHYVQAAMPPTRQQNTGEQQRWRTVRSEHCRYVGDLGQQAEERWSGAAVVWVLTGSPRRPRMRSRRSSATGRLSIGGKQGAHDVVVVATTAF